MFLLLTITSLSCKNITSEKTNDSEIEKNDKIENKKNT